MSVGTFATPDHTTQTGTAYKTDIDNSIAVTKRFTDWFAPRENDTPNMTVKVDAGYISDYNGNLTEYAAQNSATITAPTTNPRIDRIVVDPSDGSVDIIAGTEAASPSAPAITAGKIPIAQISLVVSQTTITNTDITDERVLTPFYNLAIPNNLTVQNDATINGDIVLSGNINDSNGNELLKFTTVGSAVNELTISNAATGNNPQISATGTNAAISINMVSKGNAPTLRLLGNSSTSAEIRMFENTSNGTNYVGQTVVANVTTSYTITWPAAVAEGFLKSNSSGELSFEDAGGLVLIDTDTVSAASEAELVGMDSTYDEYIIETMNCTLSATTPLNLQASTNSGTSYLSGSSDYNYILGVSAGNNDSSSAQITDNMKSPSNVLGQIKVNVFNPSDSSNHKNIRVDATFEDNNDRLANSSASVRVQTNTAINAIRIYPGTGTISGTFKLYGVKK